MHNKNSINILYLTQNCHLIIGDSKGFLNIKTILKLQNENNENNIEIFKESSIVNDDERKMILDWIAPIKLNFHLF